MDPRIHTKMSWIRNTCLPIGLHKTPPVYLPVCWPSAFFLPVACFPDACIPFAENLRMPHLCMSTNVCLSPACRKSESHSCACHLTYTVHLPDACLPAVPLPPAAACLPSCCLPAVLLPACRPAACLPSCCLPAAACLPAVQLPACRPAAYVPLPVFLPL
jgi:hypothetical protein